MELRKTASNPHTRDSKFVLENSKKGKNLKLKVFASLIKYKYSI